MWSPTAARIPGVEDILVTGGFKECCSGTSDANDQVALYNPSANTWTSLGTIPNNTITPSSEQYTHIWPLAQPVTLRKVPRQLVMAGFQGRMTFYNADPALPSDTPRWFEPRVAKPTEGSAGGASWDATALLAPTGELLSAGSGAGAISTTVDLYDPVKRTWRSIDTGIQRSDAASVLLPDGTVLMVNGASTDDEGQPVVTPPQIVDLWSGQVSTLEVWADDPLPRGLQAVALLLRDGRVLIGGGRGGRRNTIACERSDMRVFTPPYLRPGRCLQRTQIIPPDGNPSEGGGAEENGQEENGIEENPDEGRSEEGLPDERRFEEGTPEDGRREDGRREDGRPENGRPEDGRPEDGRPEDGSPDDGSPEDGRPDDSTPGDNRPTDGGTNEIRPDEVRPERENPDEDNADERNPEGQPLNERPPFERPPDQQPPTSQPPNDDRQNFNINEDPSQNPPLNEPNPVKKRSSPSHTHPKRALSQIPIEFSMRRDAAANTQRTMVRFIGPPPRETRGASLMAFGSFSRGYDQGQRYVAVDVVERRDGEVDLVVAPGQPPISGLYNLFLIAEDGTPSVGVLARITLV